MPITINRETLSRACQVANSVPNKDAKFPVTQTAFLSFADNRLTVKACDLANWLSLDIDAQGDTLPDIQLETAKLADVVRTMKGETIRLDVKDGLLILLGDNRSRRTIGGNVLQYPEVQPPVNNAERIDAEILKEAVSMALKVMPNLNEKPDYQGVRVEGGHAVGTDGIGLFASPVPLTGEFTIAPGTTRLFKHLPDEGIVTVTHDDRKIALAWDGGSLVSSQFVAGSWGFMKRGLGVILKDNPHTLHVLPSDILAAVSAVKPVIEKDRVNKSDVARINLSSGSDGCSVAPENGGVEYFDAEWDGPDFQVKFSAERLIAVLGGFASDMPVSFGITPLPERVGSTVRQACNPDRVGMIMQILQ